MDKQYAQAGTNTVAAGGTAETVVLGFKPSYVRVTNINNLVVYEHWTGMADGTSLDTGNHDTTQISLNAAASITLTSNGFTLGTDICDTTDDVVRWVAFR